MCILNKGLKTVSMSGMSIGTCTERCIVPISLSDSELCELYESLFGLAWFFFFLASFCVTETQKTQRKFLQNVTLNKSSVVIGLYI